MKINGESFSVFELELWHESEKTKRPVKNYNLFMKIISAMASAILGWHI